MTTDVRELLRAGAASPATDVDLDRVMREARGRRRRRGTVAVAGVLVLAVATLGVVRATDDGGSSARIAIGPRQSSEVPDGWTRVELDSGIRYAMPPGWDTFDFGGTPPAERRIAIGTARPTDNSVLNACTSAGGQLPTQPGTWLSLWEYPSSSGAQVVGPGGGETFGVVDRPADFRTTGASGSCRYAGDADTGELGAAFEIEAFRDGGRVFVARVVTAYPASSAVPDQLQARLDTLTEQIQALGAQIAAEPPDVDVLEAQLAALKNQYQVTYDEHAQVPDPAAPGLLLGNEVLNSLRVSPLEPATTLPASTIPSTTVPATNAVPLPATTVPPLVPTTSDEQAISDLFVGWLRDHPDDETRATVEDGDALLDAIHQGLAQHSAADLAKYSGVVNAIRPIDADHASVDYTLLFAGQPQFGVRTGTAVRIDGVWKVSRDTECALLSLGGIRCPAGSAP